MRWRCACVLAALWLFQPPSRIAGQSTFRATDLRPVTVPAFDAEPGLHGSSSRTEYDEARADARYVFEQSPTRATG
jgi:hypothetical protein